MDGNKTLFYNYLLQKFRNDKGTDGKKSIKYYIAMTSQKASIQRSEPTLDIAHEAATISASKHLRYEICTLW